MYFPANTEALLSRFILAQYLMKASENTAM